MLEVSLKEMLEAGCHFGHQPAKWNPRMAPYIYGVRGGIHVFDLEKTAQKLVESLDFLANQSKIGKVTLLVGTKLQARQPILELAAQTKSPYVVGRWIGGLLTNFEEVRRRIGKLTELKRQKESGELDKFIKKEKLLIDKQMEKLEEKFGGVEKMDRRPDILFVIDAVRDNIAIQEANKLGIPVIAIVDSNANPAEITYPIPANDDALNSLKYVISKIGEAIQVGQTRKAKGKDDKEGKEDKDDKEEKSNPDVIPAKLVLAKAGGEESDKHI